MWSTTIKYLVGIAAIYYGYTYLNHQWDLARYGQLEQLVIQSNNDVINTMAAANANDISKNVYIDQRTGRGYLDAAYM